MSPSRRRAATRILSGLVAGALLAAAPGCAAIESLFGGTHVADNPQWQVARFKGVSSSDVLRLAQTAVEHWYPPKRLDAYRGEFETGWIYGLFDDVRRNPLRQKIVVHVETEEGVLVVKLRAQQEMNDSAGRLADANDTGWDIFDDDPARAVLMMQRLCILLKDIAERVPDPKNPDEKT
jgi:hypothetical protein